MNLYCRSVINDSDTSPLIIHTNNHDGDCFIIKYIGSFVERSDNVVDSGHYTVPSGYIRFRYISPENPITIMFDSEHFISFEQIINDAFFLIASLIFLALTPKILTVSISGNSTTSIIILLSVNFIETSLKKFVL